MEVSLLLLSTFQVNKMLDKPCNVLQVLTANSFETVNLNYIKLGTFTLDTQ
ncbi:hypothetical protein NC651_010407 [Populus alba x Populus x berolinensis]|nr:hypothetical protein NC651_010407 [Populus alba x Populus x berolinensis]